MGFGHIFFRAINLKKKRMKPKDKKQNKVIIQNIYLFG